MKDERDIRIMQLLSDNVRVQNELAFVKARHRNCVPLEELRAVEAERDSYKGMWEAEKSGRAAENRTHREREAEWAKEKAEYERRLKEKDREISGLSDTNALLTADKFGPSSEIMESLFGKETRLPDNKTDFLAMLSQKGYECDKALDGQDKDAGTEERAAAKPEPARKEKSGAGRKPRGRDRRPRGVWVDKDSIVIPVDNSNLPKGARLIVSEEEGSWLFRLVYVKRMKVFTVAHRIARYNIPGGGQENSRYPDTLYKGCHLTPSFIGFYHRFKFGFNVSEQNILSLMRQCGCDMPQSTLNRMIHEDIGFVRGKLEPVMLAEIKESLFTHNDETRICVKYMDTKTGGMKYHEGYVHAILSPSARLVLMKYDEGSRRHDIQEMWFRGSRIRCFTCDKAKMYERIIKDIGAGLLKLQYCWGHGRRELYRAFRTCKRLRPLIELIGYLFDIERECREDGLDEQERRNRRQERSRPTVDLIFAKLRKIAAQPNKFGQVVIEACNYFLNNEDGFRAFLDDGLMEIDNNPIERCFRHIAVGRGTWQHCGGHGGAENIAFAYGLEQSCRLNGIDYGDYIEYIHERMIAGETDMSSLLPNHIKIPSDRVPEGERIALEIEKTRAS